MMAKFFFIGSLFLFLLSCNSGKKLDITTADIDQRVTEILKEDAVYDIAESMRFSKGNETYEVVEYAKGDTLALHAEIHTTETFTVNRNIFYQEGVPVYITEYFVKNTTLEDPYLERKVYLDGSSIIEATERSAEFENDLEYATFKKAPASIAEFDFERPKSAINQEGDYEMRFGEFLIIEPQTYLILENQNSGYDVALFVPEEHELLTKMYANQEEYKGKIVFTYHQFFESNGISRMAFIDAVIVEEK
jgi:hypothetical protein